VTTVPKRKPRPPEQRSVSNRLYRQRHPDAILEKRKAQPGYPAKKAAWVAAKAAFSARRKAVYLLKFDTYRAVLGHLTPDDLGILGYLTNLEVGWTPKRPWVLTRGHSPDVVLTRGHSEPPGYHVVLTRGHSEPDGTGLLNTQADTYRYSVGKVPSPDVVLTRGHSEPVNATETSQLGAGSPEGPAGDGRDGPKEDGYVPSLTHWQKQQASRREALASTDSGVLEPEW
jgi:hypothetical protein